MPSCLLTVLGTGVTMGKKVQPILTASEPFITDIYLPMIGLTLPSGCCALVFCRSFTGSSFPLNPQTLSSLTFLPTAPFADIG